MSANNKTAGSEPESKRLGESMAFLHQAREVRDLEPAQVKRIERRLRGRRARPRRLGLVPVMLALGLVLVAGAAFALAKGDLRSLPFVGPLFGPKPVVEKPAAPAFSATVSPAPPTVPPTEVAPPATADNSMIPHPTRPTQRGEREDVTGHGPRPRTLALRDSGDAHQGPPTAVAPENPIVAESRSFASVIEPWHRTRNASTALALLDAHERRYPSGHMRLESRVLRAEIFLEQGRETEAVAVLDSLSLVGLPRGRELQTVRGELRIKAGRCLEGKRDLGEVLEKGVADALAKRASQALSHCP